MNNTNDHNVGIVGWWYNLNYGGTLTYYALNKAIESLGYSVLMIQRSCPKNRIPNEDNVPRRFANKHYSISQRYSYDEMNELNQFCDAFVVGSDQLWNPYLMPYSGPEYFLSFVDDKKIKVAYATSFGNVEQCPLDFIEKYQPLLSKFDAISVRESYSVDMCKRDFGLTATQVCDPVFLCDMQNYEKIAEDSVKAYPEKYVLNFLLDPDKDKVSACRYVKEQLGITASVNFTDLQNIEEHVAAFDGEHVEANAEIEDFVKAYKNADFVVTDSFHGTCLAVLFNKPFISIANKKRGEKRFVSVLNWLQLTNRLVYDLKDIYINKELLIDMDYKKTNQIISETKQKGLTWLKRALDTGKTKLERKENVVTALDSSLCTGCGACAQICPEKAIQMTIDKDGFLRPVVDDLLCTHCGVCEKKCVTLHPIYENNKAPQCFAMMAPDNTRMISSSGGMFTVAAEYILKNGGYVCGAAYNSNYEVEHIIIHDTSDLNKLRGSKYIQSNVKQCYSRIKELLKNNQSVLFTGLPCQVAGLRSYLGKAYDNLYTLDLLCHGITSYKVFKKYWHDVLDDKDITKLEFKAKEPWGWHAGVNAWFKDGTKYSKPLEADPYFMAYLQNISKNSACAACKLNCLPRQGDLTIGDFWGVKEFDPNLNDNKGTSVVLVNNEKGKAFFELLKKGMRVVKEAPLQIAIRGNHCIEHAYPLHKNRNRFFEFLDKRHFQHLTSACLNNRVYEQEYLEQIKTLSKEDLEYYYIAKVVAKNYKGRKVVTWIRSAKLEKILKEHFGISVAFGVTQRKEAIQKGYIEDFSVLKNKKNQYFLVSLDRSYDDEIYKTLQQYGYIEKLDFVFRRHKPIVLENYDLSTGNYYDDYGNSIEGYNATIGKVILRGFNNHISVGKNFATGKNATFDLAANAFIRFGDNTRFNAASRIEVLGYNSIAKLEIGADCTFSGGAVFRFYNTEKPVSALIGDHCTSSSKFDLHANQGKKIIIGRDCMFSFETDLWAGDGHTIFDVRTGKNRNAASDTFSPQNQLVIGDHVWVGKQAFLMHGTNIGSGCVVGARSVVKGIFPNNCAIAGNPAVKVKEDVAWSREGVSNNIASCGSPDYARLTSPANAPISGRRVLVIGGTRFMGIQLVKELVALGNDVTIATRGKTKDGFGMAVSRLTLDVSDQESCKTALQGKYFDVVFDNLAYCSKFANNVLANVKCGKYIQLSSVEAYANMAIDMKEERFDPYRLPLEICDQTVGYVKGKRQAEAIVYQNYKHVDAVTIRIPYVTKTDRLYYYCRSIVKQIPMNIDDTSRGFTFIRDTEVGKFLPWIAAQNYTGPINLASEGLVTIQMILNYIQTKVGKQPVINTESGTESPFHVFNEKTFSLNMDTAKRLGYKTSNINDWFWKLMDEYIARALKE